MQLRTMIAAVFATVLISGIAQQSKAGVFLNITVAPPPLPVYVEPPIPGPDYMWTPGYWGWDDDDGDYYWVPGAWVPAPEPGLLWTPGYWGWSDGVYVWNEGYWGPHVGFYGGVCYGFGYTGVGFAGGYWSGRVFSYNRSVTNIGTSVHITNVYNKTVINNNVTNVSFNGGNGGIKAQPTQQELAAVNEHHIKPTSLQMEHQHLASRNLDLRAAKNHGKPPIAAVTKAGDFSKGHVFAAKAAGNPIKPGSFKTNTVLHPGSKGGKHLNQGKNGFTPKPGNGGLTNNKGTTANLHADHDRFHKDGHNPNVPKGASLIKRLPGPGPHPPHVNRPVGRQPPKKDKKQS